MSDVDKQRESNVGGVTGRGFLPGRSGNPAGRVKGTSFKTYLREEADKLAADGRPRLHRVADTAMVMAEGGDIRAIAFVAERLDGKVTQKFEVETVIKEYDVTNPPEAL